MKILSLNVWGGMVYEPLLGYLKAVDADIYCLQEVPRAPQARSEWLTYRDGAVELQQRANLHDEIAAILPDHDGFFAPTMRGALLDGSTPCPQFFGLSTFIRKSFPVIGQRLDYVHGAFTPHDFGAHPRSRNAHGFRVFDYIGNRPVSVVQMHGLRDPAGKHDTEARHAQAQALCALVQTVSQPGDPIVVCGDFNVLPESVTFEILGEIGLTDLVTTRGFTDTRTSLYTKPGRYADYMLVNEAIGTARFEVVATPEVSDHRALLLQIG